ncbi:heparin lyase I family protein [Actinomycetospora chibensis]|uniref:Heparin lyase I family protein n=1 Tax=Actinomycetospora chibensis TaxID=663606 RepID=A0ABV9RIT6_9PSEU|nr:heparin lyase I family protein [Actinomycetospora chibensis]MDD7925845.1 heparin lyase I family protein [Actinomycetospora chibensis]
MTDVVTHADPSSGDGRRGSRTRRAHRGLRVPGSVPAGGTERTDDDGRPRHRRTPGTAPFVATTTGATRHRAASRDAAGPAGDDDPTTPIALVPTTHAPTAQVEPATTHVAATGLTAATSVTALTSPTSTGRHAAIDATSHAPAAVPGTAIGPPSGRHAAPTSRVAAAAPTTTATPATTTGATTSGTTASSGSAEPSARRRGLPLRATIGLIGGGGVAALFALTTPGSPVSTSAPLEAAPSSAAPAGLFSPVVPSSPDASTSSALPVVPVTPPSVSSTTPTSEGPQPVIGALFDAASGAFSDLFDNSANDGLVENGPRPRIVANPDDPDRQAWQFSLGPGGKRSEVLPQGPGTEPVDGDQQFVRYTAQLSDDFPTDTGNWQVILQWHHTSPNGSPPLALQVTRGQLYMVSEGDDMQAIGPVSPGQRIDLAMKITFAQDPSEGSVTVWRDGRPTGVTNWSPRDGTMSTHAAYLKMGMYRAQAIREGGSIIVTDLKIGRDAAGIGGIGPRARD